MMIGVSQTLLMVWWVSIRSMCETFWTDIEHKSLYYLLIMQDKINLQLSKIVA